MAKLTWDATGTRLYETGTDHGVVFPVVSSAYAKGVAWTGLRLVTESPDGAEETALFADNIKYLSLMSAENFKGTIGAYTYPDEVALLDGSFELTTGVTAGQQPRGSFGLSYRTLVGNDTERNNHGYKIHLVYGATLSPSERSYESVNDSPAAVEFSWDFTTVPVEIPGAKPSAHLIIDSTKVPVDKLQALENLIYGTDTQESKMPTPAEVVALIGASAPQPAQPVQ